MDIEDLTGDDLKKRAFIRSLEIIGEASKQIPDDFKNEHEEIPWKMMSGMRDVLIHRYSGVNLRIVMDVIRNKIPDLSNDIQHLIRDLE
jgi:uncharacterized protein with HEPN domain